MKCTTLLQCILKVSFSLWCQINETKINAIVIISINIYIYIHIYLLLKIFIFTHHQQCSLHCWEIGNYWLWQVLKRILCNCWFICEYYGDNGVNDKVNLYDVWWCGWWFTYIIVSIGINRALGTKIIGKGGIGDSYRTSSKGIYRGTASLRPIIDVVIGIHVLNN